VELLLLPLLLLQRSVCLTPFEHRSRKNALKQASPWFFGAEKKNVKKAETKSQQPCTLALNSNA
jgi:hypothetical protein